MEEADCNVEFAHIYSSADVTSIDPEQQESIRRAQSIVRTLSQRGESVALSLLVDDYSCPGIPDLNTVTEVLGKAGLKPDFVMRESALVTVAQSLIDILPARLLYRTDDGLFLSTRSRDPLLWAVSNPHLEHDFLEIFLLRQSEDLSVDTGRAQPMSRYQTTSSLVLLVSEEEEKPHYSCALLTACWHLMRLGVPPFADLHKELLATSNACFFARRIMTLLPARYLKLEAAALELISVAKSKRVRRHRHSLEYVFF